MSEKNSNVDKFVFLKTYGRIAIVFFIGISIFLFFSTAVLMFLTKPSKEVRVPDVEGKKFIDVYNSIMRRGIRPELKFRDVYDIDNGIVLRQYPEKDRIVAEGSVLRLVVSRSGLFVDVPNCIGFDLPRAVNKLKNLHYHERSISLSLGVVSYIPSSKSAANIVIDQSPRYGEKVNPDRKINFLVSMGDMEADNTMPDLTGQSINLCYDLLAAKGLAIQEEIVNTGEMKMSGIVAGQVPASGSKIEKGETARLRVYWYPLREHPFNAYEKIDYKIPTDQEKGLYEAYVEDNKSRRIRFSRTMSPGQNIEFIFQRTGNAKVTILREKKTVTVMRIHVEKY